MQNCLNCGMPFEADKNKCAYCGTSYFDMSAIEIGTGKPFILKIKHGNVYITQLVKADFGTMEIKHDITDITGGFGNIAIGEWCTRSTLKTKLEFTAIKKEGKLTEVEYDGDYT